MLPPTHHSLGSNVHHNKRFQPQPNTHAASQPRPRHTPPLHYHQEWSLSSHLRVLDESQNIALVRNSLPVAAWWLLEYLQLLVHQVHEGLVLRAQVPARYVRRQLDCTQQQKNNVKIPMTRTRLPTSPRRDVTMAAVPSRLTSPMGFLNIVFPALFDIYTFLIYLDYDFY